MVLQTAAAAAATVRLSFSILNRSHTHTHTPKLNVLSLWNICKRHCSDHRQNASADNGSRTTGNGTRIHTLSHTLSSRLKLVGFCHKSDSTENDNEVEVEGRMRAQTTERTLFEDLNLTNLRQNQLVFRDGNHRVSQERYIAR